MISQHNFIQNNNKVQSSLLQNQLQIQPLAGVTQAEYELNNYIALIQAQIIQAQQQQAQQQLLKMYQQSQFTQNPQNQSNQYNQLLLQNNQFVGLSEKNLLQNQNLNHQAQNGNNFHMMNPMTLKTNDQQSSLYYTNSKPQLDRQTHMLNNYQGISSLTNSNQLNIFGTYTQLGNNTQSDSQVAKLGMNINSLKNTSHNLVQGFALQNSPSANQSPIQNQNFVGIAHPQMQSPRKDTQNNTQQISINCSSVIKKIKKSCNNCQNCIKKEQVALRKIPSCSSSQSSESTNPIFDSCDKKQSSKVSSKKNNSNPSKSYGKQKISRLEETRAERWSFMKKFYNKQILINRIFIDLEDENNIIQPTLNTELVVKKEDDTQEENSFSNEINKESNINDKNKIANECSASVTSQSQTIQNSPQAEKSSFRFSGYSSSQESTTSLESATHL